ATTENVKASARMMSVEQHYSGGNGKLSQDFSDQLTNGILVTEQSISTGERDKSDDLSNLSKQQRVTSKIKKDAEGKPL
ncbi:hypothetical protein SB763_35990, partial [Burkholderia sp. SIMBA_042]|uniref:hypothetical protein n=1 Tax=Burkholderia sp. SIMBA_042 TaxID=3085783 RepID=UPI003979BC0F